VYPVQQVGDSNSKQQGDAILSLLTFSLSQLGPHVYWDWEQALEDRRGTPSEARARVAIGLWRLFVELPTIAFRY